jgi:hypothetical protein
MEELSVVPADLRVVGSVPKNPICARCAQYIVLGQ